jgi:hypothetical protein
VQTLSGPELVADLHAGKLTPDEAEERFSDRIRGWRGPPADLEGFARHIGMSPREYTAVLHGASLEHVARLRYSGWPETCARCSRDIDYAASWWLIASDEPGGDVQVNCGRCGGHPALDVVPWRRDIGTDHRPRQ